MAISLNEPLDLSAPDASAFLDGIQGNILKSHGRNAAAHARGQALRVPASVTPFVHRLPSRGSFAMKKE